ncbi:hypothetical protein HOLleu_09477 [Holothuria leucospilota]|uniref:Uncharacterized protein n=1 Tax=Holothuria leucospilota TaxID=206669 RepID=A0A9Q1CCA8_HOLLE|nr:hypothetical protein HOLleu_09477 [Holothuria leucospilota]
MHFRWGNDPETRPRKPSLLYDFTNPDWVPFQNLGHNEVNIKSVDRDANRYKRMQARDSRKKENDAVGGILSLAMGCPSPSNDVGEEFSETSCQTTLEDTSISKMETEIQRLIEENRKLKTQLNAESKSFDQHFFQDNDERVKYYTGLVSFSVLLL